MANTVQPLDGVAVTEIILVLPGQTSFSLASTEVTYIGSSLKESLDEPSIYEHRFATSSLDLVDRIARTAMTLPTPRLRFRFGVSSGQTVFWLPWQDHMILAQSAIPESIGASAGHTVHFQTVDKFYEIDRSTNVSVYSGKISDIVAEICSNNGLKNCVIEPTVNTGVYTQNFMGDIGFIRSRLQKRAINSHGVGNYLFFMRDNVLHFHTADYQTSIQDLNYSAMPSIPLVLTDNTEKLFDAGISGVRLIVYDPYSGESREVSSDPNKSLRYADSIYPTAAVKNSQLTVPYHLSTNQPEETTAIAQSIYDTARNQTFVLTPKFEKVVNIRLGDIVNLIISQRAGITSPYSGYYLVSGAAYEIKAGAVSTQFRVQRGEIKKLRSGLTTSAPNTQIVPQLDAPGQDLNLRSIADSESTRGAGNSSSEKSFVTISDANVGPD